VINKLKNSIFSNKKKWKKSEAINTRSGVTSDGAGDDEDTGTNGSSDPEKNKVEDT
jgi:hypothetical protein